MMQQVNANGTAIMSIIFLAASLINLAKRSVGCDIICDGKVYGFKPSSLLLITIALTGMLAAFFCPIVGAIIYYTKHCKSIGFIFAIFLMIIEAVQIGTVAATWFPMAKLQYIDGFFL